MAHKRKYILTLIYTIFTGTGWGLGLARTLGMDAQIPFFFQVTGVTLLAIIGGCLSAVYYRWQGKRGIEATTIAAHATPLLLPVLDVIS
ncbi:MAG: hypothetical protein JW981_11370, partial [Anaerolineae bacterium]|nr:hypothetical protein [Anaerolineae bacterium]